MLMFYITCCNNCVCVCVCVCVVCVCVFLMIMNNSVYLLIDLFIYLLFYKCNKLYQFFFIL